MSASTPSRGCHPRTGGWNDLFPAQQDESCLTVAQFLRLQRQQERPCPEDGRDGLTVKDVLQLLGAVLPLVVRAEATDPLTP